MIFLFSECKCRSPKKRWENRISFRRFDAIENCQLMSSFTALMKERELFSFELFRFHWRTKTMEKCHSRLTEQIVSFDRLSNWFHSELHFSFSSLIVTRLWSIAGIFHWLGRTSNSFKPKIERKKSLVTLLFVIWSIAFIRRQLMLSSFRYRIQYAQMNDVIENTCFVAPTFRMSIDRIVFWCWKQKPFVVFIPRFHQNFQMMNCPASSKAHSRPSIRCTFLSFTIECSDWTLRTKQQNKFYFSTGCPADKSASIYFKLERIEFESVFLWRRHCNASIILFPVVSFRLTKFQWHSSSNMFKSDEKFNYAFFAFRCIGSSTNTLFTSPNRIFEFQNDALRFRE